MKDFHCDHCQQQVFFENFRCVNCDHTLAYLPEVADMASLEPAGPDAWRPHTPHSDGLYRLCANYSQHDVCNWAVPAGDLHPLCHSCRLTRIIPDLSRPGNQEAWYRLEIAKRRLVYSLLALKLPLLNKYDDPEHGLTFEFMADYEQADAAPVLTGHSEGVVRINIAEADDAERERRRLALHEPYRTLVGHFRHEVGHYYWDRLIRDSDRLDAFRTLFGDEREEYSAALERHYNQGAPPDWQQQFVTAYASSHPWEDWAETWAHYLHMVDALETAASAGLALRPGRTREPSLDPDASPDSRQFNRLIADWFPLTHVLNNLNRGLGLPDGYPFVLSPAAIEKLHFVHDTIRAAGRQQSARADEPAVHTAR